MNKGALVLAKAIHIADKMDMEARRRLYEKGYWVTKELDVIHVSDIGNRHLINIAKYLYRIAENHISKTISAGYGALGILQGEMALMQVEGELMRLEDLQPEDFLEDHPFYVHLCKELEKRDMEGYYE